MEEIVVTVDGSEYSLFSGLVVGHELQEQSGLPLRLLSVVEPEGSGPGRRKDIEDMLPLGEAGSPRVGAAEIEVTPSQRPAEYLAQRISEDTQSLYCVATRGRGTMGEALLGSTAATLTRQASRPLLLSGPALPSGWSGPVLRILVLLDGSSFAERILPRALQLAEALDTELRLVRVAVDTAGQDTSEAASYLQALAAAWQPKTRQKISHTVLESEQDTAEAITDYAANRGSLVAMTTQGWSGLAQLALGSVAHAVVRQSSVPVMVFNPGHEDDEA
ncbi:universal stress protein [Halorhodospira halophila]|uniref:universal stress protein n=1 Tax=Halorhodospira halophila TaxID=1053 RepID=UPI001913DBF9|nr:universal stress protein [Halorhodospira halophila]MBK5937106.1 hypothetical protein [Halorhodospira halophila]